MPVDYRGCAVADAVVGHCKHITVNHPHDWACAVCIAAQADEAVAEALAEGRRQMAESVSKQAVQLCPDDVEADVEAFNLCTLCGNAWAPDAEARHDDACALYVAAKPGGEGT